MKEKLKCWQINSGLSPVKEFCKNCQAFLEKKNCWEVEEKPCTNSPATCILINCPVYQENKKEIETKAFAEDIHTVKELMESIVEKKCWEFKNCQESEREECISYQDKKSCWEVGICGIKKDECRLCPIYVYHYRFNENVKPYSFIDDDDEDE